MTVEISRPAPGAGDRRAGSCRRRSCGGGTARRARAGAARVELALARLERQRAARRPRRAGASTARRRARRRRRRAARRRRATTPAARPSSTATARDLGVRCGRSRRSAGPPLRERAGDRARVALQVARDVERAVDAAPVSSRLERARTASASSSAHSTPAAREPLGARGLGGPGRSSGWTMSAPLRRIRRPAPSSASSSSYSARPSDGQVELGPGVLVASRGRCPRRGRSCRR